MLTRPYNWYIEPKYSTGTGKLTGAVGVQNTFTPRTSIFRSITIGGTSKYEHYDKDLSFVKWSIFSNTNFKKDPRTSLSHGILLSFDHLDKEVALDQPKTDENKYNLWNVTYYYSRPNYIHELHGSTTLQTTSNFQKFMEKFIIAGDFHRETIGCGYLQEYSLAIQPIQNISILV